MSEQQGNAPDASAQSNETIDNSQAIDESSDQLESSDDSSIDPLEAQEQKIDGDPSLSPKEKAEVKKMLKSLKIKFNGREFDEELPFEIPDDPKAIEYMKKQIQMSKLAQSKSQEFSKLQQEAVDFIKELKKNPRKVLSDPSIGVDLKKLALEMVEEEIENSKKSPEQIEREKLELELKTLKSEREKEKEEGKKREFDRLQQQELERYDVLMSQALEKSTLPKSPYIVKKMADYMLMALNAGHDVTPSDVLPLVEEEMKSDLKEMFAAMPEEVIENFLGKDVFERVRKKKLQKVKQSQPLSAKSQINDVGHVKSEETDKNAKSKKSFKDFFGV